MITKVLLCLVTLGAVGAVAAQKKAAAKPAEPKSILVLPKTSTTLPNGLRIYLVKYPSRGVVAYQLPVHAGSRNEVEKGKTGFAHFFEHLMFRGTAHRTGKELNELFASLGGENNAWTWYDMTDFHGVVAGVYLPKILDAEADRFQNLKFDEKQFKDEAGAVLGEYNKDVAQPEFQLEEKLQSTAFTAHPYAHTTMGYREDILKFPERYQDVWPFFKRYYRPGNVAIVLVGDVDFDRDTKLIKEKFGRWKNPEIEPVKIPEEPPQKEPRTGEVVLNKPTQTRLAIAYKVPAFTTKNTDAAALALIAEMAFSVTSDFQKTYRFEKKWLDEVDASPIQSVDPGLWTINLRFSDAGEKHVDEVQKAVEKTVSDIRTKPPAQDRLTATKRRFRNAALTSWFGSPDKLADRIAWYTNFEPDFGVIDRIFERIDAVTPNALKQFADQYLVPNGRTTITLRGKS